MGTSTNTVVKKALAPNNTRWERVLAHIEATSTIKDVVVSGGDCYFLAADELYYIGARLISIKHVRRIRFASKGLAVWPSRIANDKDRWTRTLIEVTKLGRTEGKAVALHTHFNHPSEVTWITSLAAERLFKEGVTVRNQTVLLRGVNDDVRTMSVLISRLADINIQPVGSPKPFIFPVVDKRVVLCLSRRHGQGGGRSPHTLTDHPRPGDAAPRYYCWLPDAAVRAGPTWGRRKAPRSMLSGL